MKRIATATVLLLILGSDVRAQAPAPMPTSDAPSANWHVDFSLMNAVEGNINHDPEPVRSYGVAPGASLRYERGDAFELGYDIALNRYTGTDEWDRISHGFFAVGTRRWGRVRFETAGGLTLKGSSEDRELANEVGASQRVVVKITSSTRVAVTGALRYKQYPLDPETSGASPYAGAKLERRFGDGRLSFGYKYQTRHSQAVRDRYRRHAYSVSVSTPIDLPGDELSFEFEYRPQTYERLIRVGDARELRHDLRLTALAAYERPVSTRVAVIWLAALETRTSNDPDKRYTAPSLAMTMRYRWR